MIVQLCFRPRRRRVLSTFLSLLVTACASAPPPPSRSAEDPSNPNAAEARGPTETDGSSTAPLTSVTASVVDAGATATVYGCPMHPDVTSSEPGRKCPKCGMTLVPRKASP